jgi:hypothetical protein
MAPIADPTQSPISNPTLAPTAKPIADPTEQPTKYPTLPPTDKPVANPTEAPVADPTPDPTMNPLAVPTLDPISFPTYSPFIVDQRQIEKGVIASEAALVKNAQEAADNAKKAAIDADTALNTAIDSRASPDIISQAQAAKSDAVIASTNADTILDTHKKLLDEAIYDSSKGVADNYLICEFTFSQGVTKTEVPPGCVFFGENDINFPKQRFMDTPALYVCANSVNPYNIDTAAFTKYGLVDKKTSKSMISYIKPGDAVSVQFYDEDNLSGNSATFTKHNYKVLFQA